MTKTLTKNQRAFLVRTADVLDKLAEKCGGHGGTPGPCPEGGLTKPILDKFNDVPFSFKLSDLKMKAGDTYRGQGALVGKAKVGDELVVVHHNPVRFPKSEIEVKITGLSQVKVQKVEKDGSMKLIDNFGKIRRTDKNGKFPGWETQATLVEFDKSLLKNDTMKKSRIALLEKAADILERLAEKCGGRGGTPGPCPGPRQSTAPRVRPASGNSIGSSGYKPDKDPTQSDRHDKIDAKVKIKVDKKQEVIDAVKKGTAGSNFKYASEAGKKKLQEDPFAEMTPEDWTPERRAMHEKIIAEHFKGKTPVDKPTAVLMGGGPAAGKSSVLDSGQVKLDKNSVHIDSDAIKVKSLPEYDKLVDAGDVVGAAAWVHEESSYIAKQIQSKGSKESYNTVLDGTGDGSVKGLEKKINEMRAAGQRVVGHYVTIPTDTAWERALERSKPKYDANGKMTSKGGRLPPETLIRATHKSVSNILPVAAKKGLFDEVALYDTDVPRGKPAQLVMSAKGSDMTIHSKELYDRFLAKANE